MIVYDSKNEQEDLVILAPTNVNLASKLADLGLLETNTSKCEINFGASLIRNLLAFSSANTVRARTVVTRFQSELFS